MVYFLKKVTKLLNFKESMSWFDEVTLVVPVHGFYEGIFKNIF